MSMKKSNDTIGTTRRNIKKFYMVLTLHLSVRYGLFPRTTLTDRLCLTKVESIYCAVHTESLYKREDFRL